MKEQNMVTFNLDKNYKIVQDIDSIYKDDMDDLIDKILPLVDQNKISKEEAYFLLGVLLKHKFKNEIKYYIRNVVGEKPRSRETLFIEASNKVEYAQ